MSDGSKIFHQFSMRHAATGIGNSNGGRLIVGGDRNSWPHIGLMYGFAGRLIKSQFFAGIRGVRDEFANEDFFVRVKGMDDDVQQLLDFSLKMMSLFHLRFTIYNSCD